MLPTPIHALAQQEDCFSNIAQDFLICTTIHKARQLGVFQGEIYVRVTLDNIMIRHTKVFANSENPYFNEVSWYFMLRIIAGISRDCCLYWRFTVFRIRNQVHFRRIVALDHPV